MPINVSAGGNSLTPRISAPLSIRPRLSICDWGVPYWTRKLRGSQTCSAGSPFLLRSGLGMALEASAPARGGGRGFLVDGVEEGREVLVRHHGDLGHARRASFYEGDVELVDLLDQDIAHELLADPAGVAVEQRKHPGVALVELHLDLPQREIGGDLAARHQFELRRLREGFGATSLGSSKAEP